MHHNDQSKNQNIDEREDKRKYCCYLFPSKIFPRIKTFDGIFSQTTASFQRVSTIVLERIEHDRFESRVSSPIPARLIFTQFHSPQTRSSPLYRFSIIKSSDRPRIEPRILLKIWLLADYSFENNRGWISFDQIFQIELIRTLWTHLRNREIIIDPGGI